MDSRIQQYTIQQNWDAYTPDEHQLWQTLFHRQQDILKTRAVKEFLQGVSYLGMEADGIPNFEHLNQTLTQATGWQVVAVPSLVPDDIFFKLLADRCFPSTCFIRRPDQIDYLQEPDVFHDIFGHVPLLVQPIFADYMQAYGKAGLKALGTNSLHYLARLYWYTVEFGLIDTAEGLRIYGSGIVSSAAESKYSLEDSTPNRICFDLKRVMRTNYRIDDFQETYFVVSSFKDLIKATTQDLMTIYEELKTWPDFTPGEVLAEDKIYQAT